jgi:very-short-patch-repair endonuclease
MKKRFTHTARKLRNNPTKAEVVLWNALKTKQIEGVKFRRQQPIEGFIVDLVSLEKRIVIELDGGQHNEDGARDAWRDKILEANGFRVVRFWNNEVLRNLDGVVEVIRTACLE